jgi:tetratricopeptide (TPR) repeat protein
MFLAELTDPKTDAATARAALRKAHELDATQSDPLRGLLALAEEGNDRAGQVWALTQLARLEEHDPTVYRRLLAFLVEDKAYAEALKIAEAAVYADMEGATTHVLYARALAGLGRFDEASFEFESAALTPSPPSELAEARVAYSDFLKERGQAERAAVELARARELDPEHPRFKPAGAP